MFPVVVLFTNIIMSPIFTHNQKLHYQPMLLLVLLVVVVESWAPAQTMRQMSLLQKTPQNRYGRLGMIPIQNQDEINSLRFSTNDTISKQKEKSLKERIDSILKFVDNKVASSSTKADTGSILERVYRQHRGDFDTANASPLEVEERGTEIPISPFAFDRITYPDSTNPTKPTLAIRSMEPILDTFSVNAVKEAAEDVWKVEKDEDANTSRFTYQYSGNSEAHVFDFIMTSTTDSAGNRAISSLNEALQKKIYPTIREAFFQTNGGSHEDDDGTRLFVYDALVIRYNSTKAAESAEVSGKAITSAGQPLHRDLGLVSVNIMLNSAEEFEGGGTFFENQLLEKHSTTTIEPLKPSGIGYCLAHSASERHAGAGTTSGVRDILVLFVSACTGVGEASTSIEAPAELLSARLKNCRSFCEPESAPIESEDQWMEAQRSSLMCRIMHQRLAVTAGPKSNNSLLVPEQSYCDGEALQYLGTALMEYSSLHPEPNKAISVLKAAKECFEIASLVTPCDSRVCNNMGIILGTLDEMERKYGSTDTATRTRRMTEQETAYQKGLTILQRSIKAGCANESLTRDLESLSLNYGLFVANQDRFHDAAEILEPVADANASTEAGRDAYRLWKYCKERSLD